MLDPTSPATTLEGLPVPPALVGRQAELAVLTELTSGLAAGQGATVWIEGEPGIGKSALVWAAALDAAGRGCEIYHGIADELTLHLPLRAVLDCLDLSERTGPDGAHAEVAALPGRADVGLLAGGDPVAGHVERILELVDRLCANTPMVLILDDIHLADPASLTVWERLAATVHQLPLLLVSAARPAAQRRELLELRRALVRHHARMLSLGPMPADDVASLATNLLGGSPGRRLGGLLEHAAGNPLYLTEICAALVRTRALRVEAGTAELSDTAEEIPPSLATAVTDRLAALSGQAMPALRVAAILGADCTPHDLAVVLGEPVEWLAPILADAVSAGILATSGQHITFRHPLIREALLAQLPQSLRAALHRQAAQALAKAGTPAVRVAAMLLHAIDIVDAWTIDWLVQTATDLAPQAPAATEALVQRVLGTLPDDDPRRESLELALLHLHLLQARHEETEQLARRLLRQTRDPDLRAQAGWALGISLVRKGRLDAAAELSDELAHDATLPPHWRARLHTVTATALIAAGRGDEAHRHGRAALTLAEDTGDRAAIGYAFRALSVASSLRDEAAAGLVYAEHGLTAVGEDPKLADLRLQLTNDRVTSLMNLDRGRDVDGPLGEALRLAERAGTARLIMIRATAADFYYDAGRWDEALAELDAVDRSFDEQILVRQRGIRALIAVRRNDRETAASLLASLEADLQRWSSSSYLLAVSTRLVTAKALYEDRSGRPTEAVAALAPLVEPDVGQDRYYMSHALPLLVRLALPAGDHATAEAAVAAADADADREGTRGAAATAAHCHGLLEEDAESVLAAADVLRDCGWLVPLSAALEDASVLLARHDDGERARTAHAEAHELYVGFGAEWDIRRLDARLRPYGIRRGERGPRRRPRKGWEALTPTEQRVAAGVARGLSNPDIAVELIMSRRTVQAHVSNILAKLDARSRVEIAHEVAIRRSVDQPARATA